MPEVSFVIQTRLPYTQGQFLFEPPTGPVLVQPIDRLPIFRSPQPNLMASCVSG